MKREDEIDKMIEEEISGKSGEKQELKVENDDIEYIEDEDLEETDSEHEDKEAGKNKQSKNKKSKSQGLMYNIMRYVVMAIALVVFGYAAYELTLIYVESQEAEELKDSTSDMFLVDVNDLDESEMPTDSNGNPVALENQGDGQLFVFDYEKMLSINSHAKGYIRQDDGEYIDNPIVQHPTDNEYYLTHMVNHATSSVGAIYIDSAIEEGLNAKNCIIYGHNMGVRVGKIMFGSLNWYYNQTGYYKEHPTFDIWVGDTHYRYYVFAIYKTPAVGSWVYQYSFSSGAEFMEYIGNCRKASKYTFSEAPAINENSHIVTLSTCTHTDEMRMIVQLVRGEELDVYGNPVE